MKSIILLCLILAITSNNLRNTADWSWEKAYNDLVKAHNTARSKHRVGSLTKLADLATMAKKATDHCVKKSTLEHTRFTY